MQALIYETSTHSRRLMVNCLIQNGIKALTVETPSEIIPALRSKGFPVLICDCDSDDIPGIISDIKNDEQLRTVHVILHTSNSRRDFICNMVTIGITGIILKPFRYPIFEKNLHKILEKCNFPKERRKHVRIVPAAGDNARAVIRNPATMELIKCTVKDISAGGSALELGDPELADLFKPNHRIKNIQVYFRTASIDCDAIITGNFASAIAIQFIDMAPYHKSILADYIADHISSF